MEIVKVESQHNEVPINMAPVEGVVERQQLRKASTPLRSPTTSHISSQLEIEESDIKIELKQETDNSKSECYPLPLTIEHSVKKIPKMICMCHIPFLMLCPACDTSFKGGLSRISCLLNHVRSEHQMSTKELLKFIRAKYVKKAKCQCRVLGSTHVSVPTIY